jgi:hypothetical protein
VARASWFCSLKSLTIPMKSIRVLQHQKSNINAARSLRAAVALLLLILALGAAELGDGGAAAELRGGRY